MTGGKAENRVAGAGREQMSWDLQKFYSDSLSSLCEAGAGLKVRPRTGRRW